MKDNSTSPDLASRVLLGLVTRVIAAPRTTLALALALAAVGVLLATTLSFSSSRFELIGEAPALDRFLARYGSPNDLVAVVEAEDDVQARAAIDALAAEVSENDEISRVLSRVDLGPLEGKELLLLPPEELEGLLLFFEQEDPTRPLSTAELLRDARNRLAGETDEEVDLDSLDDEDEPTFDSAAGLGFLLRLLDALASYLEQPEGQALQLGLGIDNMPVDAERYFVSNDGRSHYLFASLVRSSDRYDEVEPVVRSVRAAAREVMRTHPGVTISWTGYPAISVDEVDAIKSGSTFSGVAAAILVIVIFMVWFRARGAFLFASIPLFIGIAWAFGMIALTVGELNLLTQVAAPVFFGLGDDFSVHLIAAYERARREGHDHETALATTWSKTGTGVLTGCATTCAAFLALTVTDQRAFQELGWVTALGLVLTLLAILTVTPALLTLGERHRIAIFRLNPRPLPASNVRAVSRKKTWVTIAVSISLLLALASGLPRLSFDRHVEALLPEDAESVRAAEQMRETSGFSNEFIAFEVADLATLRTTVAALEAQPSVGRVESAEPFFPDDSDARVALVSQLPRPLPGIGRRGAISSPSELEHALGALASEARRASDETRVVGVTAVADQLAALAERASSLEERIGDRDAERIASFDRALVRDVDRARTSASIVEARAITIADLPPVLRERWSHDDHFAIYAYPANDVFEPGELDRFVAEVTGVQDSAVGYPIQLKSFLASTQRGLRNAIVVALIAIFLLILLEFRRLKETLLAMLPVVVSFPACLGALAWLGLVYDVQLDLAGAAALPLLLGIGVDDGVHLVHRVREVGAVTPAVRSIGGALVLTTLTTVAGFGTIGFAPHRGMQSFAIVMVIGVFICLVVTVTLLPAVLRLFEKSPPKA